MIAPLLSAHRSQIREWDRPMLLYPLSFGQAGEAGAAINWNSELFSLFWSVLDIRGRGCYPSTKTVLLLPERGEERSLWNDASALASSCCRTQQCYASSYKKADMMTVQFQHESLYQPYFTCPAISFNIHNIIMCKSVNVWHIISWVCIIYRFTFDVICLHLVYML